ncbi:MAG: 4-amino-4-deoxy-L-arabinose transferase [Isosphaeraceae bacterium]|nr:4-amino-4-deoxy-L-arabinose transferase [Isosphaeraceae bacterium]
MGWFWVFLLNSLLGLSAYGVARDGLRQPAGLPRLLAAATLAWAWATLGVLGLGLVGALGRWPLLAWVAVGLLVAAGLRFSRPPGPEGPPQPGEPWGLSGMLALALVLWAALLLGLPSLLLPVKVVSDGPIYHLYFAARWWKAGRIFLIATPFGETAAPYFPAGGDLWFTWLLTGLGGDRLARVGQVPFFAMAGAATYALARRLAVGAASALVAMCWFLTILPLLLFSFEANVDTIFIAGYLTAVYFGLRYALGDGGAGTITLAGLAAGGAWGTKPTATVFIPVLLALGGIVVLSRARPLADRLVHLGLWLGTPMVLAGYWFGRNAWLTGNPLYPLQVSVFGRVWLTGWYDAAAMTRSHYYIPVHDARALIDILVAVLDPRLLPLWAAALAGAWALGLGGRPLGRWIWGCSALAVANLALYWLLIPYRTQQRFMLQALGLAAVPLGRLLDRAGGLRWAAVLLLAIHLTTPPAWPILPLWGTIPWDLSAAIPEVENAPIPLSSLSQEGSYWGSLLALGLGCGIVAWLWGQAAARPSVARWARALGALAILVGTSAALFAWSMDAARFVYPNFPDYLHGWRELEGRCGRDGARIAYAGTNLPYYLMGADLRNEVRYVNIDAHRGWLLHDYHREACQRGRPNWPTPRPGWDRLQPDYAAWLANLRAEGIQLLVVARANPVEGPFNIADPQHFPIERQWAEAHPEDFEPLYGVAEADPQFRIYRIRPPRR